MNLTAFLSSFGLIFVAELGDKTQLTAIALAARYRWTKAFGGVASAFVVLNIAAVGVGRVLFDYVPLTWVRLASAAVFLLFGVLTFRDDGSDDNDDEASKRVDRGPFLTSFILIFLAELGDKTQIVTATLSAQRDAPVSVFMGSTLALWLVSLLGLLLGAQIRRRLSQRLVHRAAGVMFIVFGIVSAIAAFR
jgi:putative Ca2+/H+ antiporter (TMEM165/GDT1 family)